MNVSTDTTSTTDPRQRDRRDPVGRRRTVCRLSPLGRQLKHRVVDLFAKLIERVGVDPPATTGLRRRQQPEPYPATSGRRTPPHALRRLSNGQHRSIVCHHPMPPDAAIIPGRRNGRPATIAANTANRHLPKPNRPGHTTREIPVPIEDSALRAQSRPTPPEREVASSNLAGRAELRVCSASSLAQVTPMVLTA